MEPGGSANADSMDSSTDAHLIWAGLSVLLVFVTQIARCYVKWYTRTVAIRWLALLGGWAVVLGALGLACVVLHYEDKSASELAHLLFALCKGIPILSIWVFLVRYWQHISRERSD